MSATSPLFFCLRLPEFAAQALLRLRAEQRLQAVAVLDGMPPLESVCAVNGRARSAGVVRGLTRAELSSVPGIVILRRSIQEEQSTCAALFEMAWSITSRVEKLSDITDCVLALDMSGSERLWGPPRQAARKILHAVRRLKLTARITVASNLQTAVCISRVATEPVTIVAQGHESSCLAGLPLAALEPSPEHAEILELWGIRTSGELAALPAIDLVARLGQEGRRLWLLARGECEHLLVPAEPASALEEGMEFDAAVENLDSLLFVLSPMLHQLLFRAARRALALVSITATFTLDGGGTHERTVKPALPVADHAILLKLLQLDLQAHPPSAGIVAVHLAAEAGARREIQEGLFLPQAPEPTRLEVTLARLAALVGEDRAGRPVLTDSHAPESFRMERFVAKPGHRLQINMALSPFEGCAPGFL